MNIPRWLLFVVGGVAALAVGVAAVLIGMRFASAPVASAFVPPDTEVSQVIAPVAIDNGDDGVDEDGDGDASDAPPASTAGGSTGGGTDSSGEAGTGPAIGTAAGDDDDQPEPSPVIAEEDVSVPEADPAVTDHELLRLVDLIGRDPSLFDGLFTFDLGGRDDDPCAPASGTPADDCPLGIPGAVYINDEIPPLWLNPIAFPHTHASAHDLPARPIAASLKCDIDFDVTDATSTVEVPLRIRSSVPGNWSVRYWPTGDEGSAQVLPLPPETDQQITDYQADLDLPGDDWFAPEQCIRLPEVLPGVPYTAVVTGNDYLGRPAPPATVLFNSGGEPGHASLQLRTVGQNLLIASAAHKANEDVLFQSYLVGSNGDPHTCAAPGAGAEEFFATTSATDSPVDATARLELNITDDNTLADYVSYRVPEGATLLICARWFPAGSGTPTWESAQATYESSAVVQTANRLLPKLVLTAFQARRQHGQYLGTDLQINVATPQGIVCGVSRFEDTDDAPPPLTVCDPSALTTGGATVDGDRLADRGFNGDLVLRINGATVQTHETSETTLTLPAGPGSCIGVCPAVPAQTFQVATIAGTATFVETWEDGRFNASSEAWALSPTVSNPIDYVAPDSPQIDTNAEWVYTGVGIASGVATASLSLPVDRHVQWTLTTGDGTLGAVNCAATPALPSASGESHGNLIGITLPFLCLGQNYTATLRLVDDAGHVAVWSILSSTNRWGANANINPPFVSVTVRYRVDVAGTREQYLQNYGIWLDGIVYPLVNLYASPAGSRCLRNDGIVMSEGRFDDYLASHLDIGLVVRLVPRRDVAPGADEGCGGYTVDERVTPAVVATVPITDFAVADGVRLTLPGGQGTLHVWIDPRH
jgi:hypothetical protein